VEKDVARIARKEKLSPLLLYRDKTNGQADYRRRLSPALRGLQI
jgi:hypothetical protein